MALCPLGPSALYDLSETIKTARKHAFEGKYAGAMLYFDKFNGELNKNISCIKDPHTVEILKTIQKKLKEEFHIVKDLETEMLRLKERPQDRPQTSDHPSTPAAPRRVTTNERTPVKPRINHMRRPNELDDLRRRGRARVQPSARPRPSRARPVSQERTTEYDRPWLPPKPAKVKGGAAPDTPPKTVIPGISPLMIEAIERDLMDKSPGVRWDDIAGLTEAKRLLKEAFVLPMVRPEFFRGIRRPWRGILMFGPPGTGKTMLAKAVASECGTSFFLCSPSTIASKYRGESEQLVKTLFAVARHHAPSTIFFDEIDGLISSRGGGGEHESSRRVKGEILAEIDGAGTFDDEDGKPRLVTVIGATNYPWDLDEAMRRRLEKRIYIPLPDVEGREQLFRINLREIKLAADVLFRDLVELTHGYSCADITSICRDAAFNPLRRRIVGLSMEEIKNMTDNPDDLPVAQRDFLDALERIKSSVSPEEVRKHAEWSTRFQSV